MKELHPLELRDLLNSICQTCGKPKRQTYIKVSHRGMWKHDSSKLTVRAVGDVCRCKAKTEGQT